LTDFPFVPGDYPPFYPLLNAVAIKLFGLNLWSGRLISFLATIGISVVLYLWVYRATRRGSWASCICLVPFLSPLFFNRTAFYRVDVLAATLSFLGVYLLSVSKGERGDLPAVAILVLALYTKHSMVAAPVACFLYLFFIDRRRALRLAGWLCGTGGAIFLLCTIATRREFFRHLILYHAMSCDLETFRVHCQKFVSWTAPFIFCWSAILVLALVRRRKPSLAELYCAACLVHFLFLRRAGASMHYLLEPSVACFLATGLLLPRIEDTVGRKSYVPVTAAVLLALAIAIQFRACGGDYAGEKMLTALRVALDRDRQIMDEVRARPGEILAENPSYALLAGRDMSVSRFHIAQLAREGRFDQSRIIQAIERGRFSLIILHSPAHQPSRDTRVCFTDEMLAAIAEHYFPLPDRYAGRWLYGPRR